jgi:hypothetical protein
MMRRTRLSVKFIFTVLHIFLRASESPFPASQRNTFFYMNKRIYASKLGCGATRRARLPRKPHGGRNMMIYEKAVWRNTITTTDAFDRARSNRWAKRRMIRFQNGSALSPHAPASSTMEEVMD